MRFPFLRTICFLITPAYFFSNVAFGALTDFDSLQHLGKRKVLSPSRQTGPTVFHIQDVHHNPDVQRNIARTIEELRRIRSIDAVALEGAFEPVNLSHFQKFTGREIVAAVADQMMMQNEIPGPIYAALREKHFPRIVGIDDREHYRLNVDAYRASQHGVPFAFRELEAAESWLQQRKSSFFNSKLSLFDCHVQACRRRGQQFDDVNLLSAYFSLCKTEEERWLVRASRRMELARKLVRFSLRSAEWQEYKRLSRESFPALRPRTLVPFEKFYEQAELRDERMAQNVLKEIARSKFTTNSTIALVAGGFHTSGIDQRLVEAGCRVVTFVPNMPKGGTNAGSSYLNFLFQDDKSFLAAEPLARETEQLISERILARALRTRYRSEAVQLFRTVLGLGTRCCIGTLRIARHSFVFVGQLSKAFVIWTTFRDKALPDERVFSVEIPNDQSIDAVQKLATTTGDQLVDWYVRTMKLFNPKNDEDRKRVLEWISAQLRKAAQSKIISPYAVIDHFFHPIGIADLDILLPKYPSALRVFSKGFKNIPLSGKLSDEEFVREVLEHLMKFRVPGKPLKILVAGGAGGGKSTFATNLARVAASINLRSKSESMDAYLLSRQQRHDKGLEGLAMYERDKVGAMVESLASERPFFGRTADRRKDIRRYEEVETDPKNLDLYIFEGVLSLADQDLREAFDVGVYVNESDQYRFQNRLDRDPGLKGYSALMIAWTFAQTQLDEFRMARDSIRYASLVVKPINHAIYISNHHLHDLRKGPAEIRGVRVAA